MKIAEQECERCQGVGECGWCQERKSKVRSTEGVFRAQALCA